MYETKMLGLWKKMIICKQYTVLFNKNWFYYKQWLVKNIFPQYLVIHESYSMTVRTDSRQTLIPFEESVRTLFIYFNQQVIESKIERVRWRVTEVIKKRIIQYTVILQ